MRDAIAQRSSTMILIRAVRQPSEPHVRHAVSGPFIREANSQPRMKRYVHPASCRRMISGKTRRACLLYEGQRCALLTTKSRNTCTRATVFSSSG